MMNQILSTQMPNNNNRNRGKKANIKTIIIFFCIVILLFGISIAVVGVYSELNSKKQETSKVEETKTEPRIDVVENENMLTISVSHDKEISNIKYNWNGEESIQINGDGTNKLEEQIQIPVGTNIITIIATDINGVTKEFKAEYTGVETINPTIDLKQEDNNILKIICKNETIISKITYYFDQEEPKIQEFNDTTAEVSIKTIQGEHKLTIIIEDIDGKKKEETNTIYIPNLEVPTDTQSFIITASDSRGIEKVTIQFNDNEEEEIAVNDTKFEKTIPLEDGENRIIVKVYNTDGMMSVKRVMYVK